MLLCPHRGIPLLWPPAGFAPAGHSCWRRRSPQPGDQRQDVGEHLLRDRDLGQLERDVAPVADNLGADLDQLLAQAGQRLWLRALGHCQRAHEVAEVVGQDVELEADGVGGKGAARQPRPFDRVLAFLDVLLARAALIVEGDDTLDRPRQVGDDEVDPRVQLAWMPFDLGRDAARLVPALCPIGEAGVVTAYFLRRSPDWALPCSP
jgi:hypothetical protein